MVALVAMGFRDRGPRLQGQFFGQGELANGGQEVHLRFGGRRRVSAFLRGQQSVDGRFRGRSVPSGRVVLRARGFDGLGRVIKAWRLKCFSNHGSLMERPGGFVKGRHQVVRPTFLPRRVEDFLTPDELGLDRMKIQRFHGFKGNLRRRG